MAIPDTCKQDEAADVVAASVGSACHAEHDSVSEALLATGVDVAREAGAVRLSVGRMTTSSGIDAAADGLIAAWRQLRTR